MVGRITRDALEAKLARGEPFAILEALPASYYHDAHLPGALNVPHDAVDALAPALLPNKAGDIVVYCASATCPNSGIAAARLVALGYSRVQVYEEGKEDWIAAGLPTERG